MDSKRPILCLDFDGVLHSYAKSGWQGASVISDPPVDGAIEFLMTALESFDMAILSSRSHQWGGRRAMKKWLVRQVAYVLCDRERYDISSSPGSNKHYNEVIWGAAKSVVKKISFPRHKPPAHITIDDRALTFTGKWPDMDYLINFRPWNKQ